MPDLNDAELIRFIAERVMGWTATPLEYLHQPYLQFRTNDNQLRYYPFGISQFVTLFDPLTSWSDAGMVLEKLRDMWTEATKDCFPGVDEFEKPFDDCDFFEVLHRHADRRWPWAMLYVTPRAICLAAKAALE